VKTKKDLSRGFQELGMGVLRAAEGVGKELNGWREEGHSNRVGLSEEGERWIEGS